MIAVGADGGRLAAFSRLSYLFSAPSMEDCPILFFFGHPVNIFSQTIAILYHPRFLTRKEASNPNWKGNSIPEGA